MQVSSPARERVAFFGGTFDPPHCGHLAIARAARCALRLDTILFAPVGAQPLKPEGSTAPFDARIAMTELAIAGEPGFALSRVDAPQASGNPNYTLDTLRKLQSGLPHADLFCLMGADSFLTLRKWYGAAEIPFAATLVVASRPGERFEHLAAVLPPDVIAEPSQNFASADPEIEVRSCALHNSAGQSATLYLLPGLDFDISATHIRTLLRSGRNNAGCQSIPPSVAEYIRIHALYR